jgi:hypothetical protein
MSSVAAVVLRAGRGADRDHRSSPAVDGVDDFGIVDALEVSR